MVEDTTPLTGQGEIPPPNPRNVKLLKTVVAVLGILLVLGTIVLIGAIVYRANKLKNTPQAKGFEIESIIGKGSSVISTQLVGDRMAVRVKTAEGEEIILFDVRKGRRIGRIRLK